MDSAAGGHYSSTTVSTKAIVKQEEEEEEEDYDDKPTKKAPKKVRGASDVTRARDEGYNLAIENMEQCAPHFRVPPPLIRETFEVMRKRIVFLEGWIAKHPLEVPTHLMAEVESAQCRLLDSLAGVEVYERHMTTHM